MTINKTIDIPVGIWLNIHAEGSEVIPAGTAISFQNDSSTHFIIAKNALVIPTEGIDDIETGGVEINPKEQAEASPETGESTWVFARKGSAKIRVQSEEGI